MSTTDATPTATTPAEPETTQPTTTGPARILCPACHTVIEPGERGRGRTRPARETWPMVQLAVVGSALTASLGTLLAVLS